MGSSDTDYVFSDEYSPEGWPELDWQEFMLGEWIKGKTPSSLALRRHLAEVVRFFRTRLAKENPAFHQSGLRFIREMHREHLPEMIAMEASLAEERSRMLPAWDLWCAKAKGGVQ